MDGRFIDLGDDFRCGRLDRRAFLAGLAGSMAAVSRMAPRAMAQQVSADDARLRIDQRVSYPGARGPVGAYFARPMARGRRSAVVVVHENRGLDPHVEDVARRLALSGFVALAPDLLAPLGGTPRDPGRAREMFGKLDMPETVANLRAAVAWLAGHREANGRVGAVGFGWGGGMVNQLALAEPELAAAVVFYGMPPRPEQVVSIEAHLLLHHAGLDKGTNQNLPVYEEALGTMGKNYTLHLYEGVGHGFHNDTDPTRYDEAAAKLAWQRTVEFLKTKLG